MPLQLDVKEHEGGTVIHAKGDVDLYSSPELRAGVLKAAGNAGAALGIDLSQVTYMDSSGVATLVEGLKASGDKGKKFFLVAPSASVLRVLSLARLDTIFEIKETL